MPKNNTLTYRVTYLEKSYEKLDSKIDKILTNDLPHLQAEIASLRTEVRVLAAINIGALILVKFLI